MTADIVVSDFLNKAILAETHGILTYTRMSAQADNWGYASYAKTAMDRALMEMKHLDQFTDRLAELGGELDEDMALPAVMIGSSLPDQISIVMGLEQTGGIELYNTAVRECALAGDNVSRALFESILADEQGHLLYAEQQLAQIAQMGSDNWLSLQR